MELFKALKSLWKYIKADKWKFYIFICLIFISTIAALLYGYLFGKAVSDLVSGDFNGFVLFLFMYGAYCLIDTVIFQLFLEYLHNSIELNFMKRISKDLYIKALDLPVRAYDEHAVGEIVNRIYTDPDKVIELLSRIVNSIARIVTVIFIVAFSLTISWLLTIEILSLIGLNYLLSRFFYPKLKATQEKIKKTSDKFVSDSNQVLTGIRDVKGLGLKKIMNKLMFHNVDSLYDGQKRSRNYELAYNTGVNVIQNIFEVVIFITLGYMAYMGNVAMTLFMAFEWYVWRLFNVTREITELGAAYQKVIVSMKRISEILDNKLYKDEKFGINNVASITGNIELKDVDFAYNQDKKILDGLSMKIETGKKIAIVGKSGVGKTTIFNILLKFYHPIKGEILIDNINIYDFTEDSLREHVSIIRQDPYIFNKTIRKNFEIVKEDITLDEIRELCRKVYLDDYIMGLPKQYETLIGEGGVNLSGGQKQRLAIARVISKNSKIILFDESTSSLDNESQEYIKQTIDGLAVNHTIITIAHRLSTIVDADVIFLIHNGKVVATGTHNELLETNELYKKLYKPELLGLNI